MAESALGFDQVGCGGLVVRNGNQMAEGVVDVVVSRQPVCSYVMQCDNRLWSVRSCRRLNNMLDDDGSDTRMEANSVQ